MRWLSARRPPCNTTRLLARGRAARPGGDAGHRPPVLAAGPARRRPSRRRSTRSRRARGAAPTRSERRSLTLAFGVHHGLPEVLEPTGLSAAAPPGGRPRDGPRAARRGRRVLLRRPRRERGRAGGQPGARTRGLDFGCSSGRVVRVLGRAWPDASWEGCDPNAARSRGRREHLPGAVSSRARRRRRCRARGRRATTSPSPSRSGRTSPSAGARLAGREMRRVLVPGGLLVLTTHGANSVAHAASRRPLWQLEDVMRALHRDGHWFTTSSGSGATGACATRAGVGPSSRRSGF